MKLLKICIFFLIPMLCFGAPRKRVSTHLNTPKSVNPIIIVDAGHGGLDLGARVRFPHCEEKRLTLTTALLLKRYLNQFGYKVILTRSTDLFVPLPKRVQVANQSRSVLFVSVHYNSCGNQTANGIEVYYCDNAKKGKSRIASSKKLADHVLSRIITRTKAVNRGVKKANFYVIRETKMPAVLIEGGFITNKSELSKLKNKNYLDQIARGIAEGVDKYLKS